MVLSSDQNRRLQRVLNGLHELLKTRPGKVVKTSQPTRVRRTGKELEAFKKAIVSERKRGAVVSELAAKFGVTPSYIYQLPVQTVVRKKAKKETAPVKVREKSRKTTSRKALVADVSSEPEVAEAAS